MALFLIRAAVPAGIDLPRAVDHGFEDIGGLSREVRTAINQLVELEITQGTTTKTFSPDDIVNRLQMALFLARFLDKTHAGEGGTHISDTDPDDEQFLDIEELPHRFYDSIRSLFELGVTTGTSRTRFSPERPVTRAQMAVFISRMLAHTNARPAGVTIQVETTSIISGDTVDIVVSVRNNRHQPVEDALVDLFSAESADKALNSNGTCTSRVTSEFGNDALRDRLLRRGHRLRRQRRLHRSRRGRHGAVGLHGRAGRPVRRRPVGLGLCRLHPQEGGPSTCW